MDRDPQIFEGLMYHLVKNRVRDSLPSALPAGEIRTAHGRLR